MKDKLHIQQQDKVIRVLVGIVFFGAVIYFTLLYFFVDNGKFVRGETGNICYSTKGIPKSVRHPIYFDNQTDCLNSFN